MTSCSSGTRQDAKGCRAARARAWQQARDEMCRTRILNDLTRTAQGGDRIDKDEEMRPDMRARVEMDVGDGHDKPAEARN